MFHFFCRLLFFLFIVGVVVVVDFVFVHSGFFVIPHTVLFKECWQIVFLHWTILIDTTTSTCVSLLSIRRRTNTQHEQTGSGRRSDFKVSVRHIYNLHFHWQYCGKFYPLKMLARHGISIIMYFHSTLVLFKECWQKVFLHWTILIDP